MLQARRVDGLTLVVVLLLISLRSCKVEANGGPSREELGLRVSLTKHCRWTAPPGVQLLAQYEGHQAQGMPFSRRGLLLVVFTGADLLSDFCLRELVREAAAVAHPDP